MNALMPAVVPSDIQGLVRAIAHCSASDALRNGVHQTLNIGRDDDRHKNIHGGAKIPVLTKANKTC